MAALPYIQLYVADYLADTMHLTTEEHGAYLLLIMNYWQTAKPIPKKRLASVARLSNDRWKSVEVSLNEYFTEDEQGCWYHSRIAQDLLNVMQKCTQASEAGKASAKKRALAKAIENKEILNGRSNPVERKPNHKDKDKDKDKDKKNKQELDFSVLPQDLSGDILSDYLKHRIGKKAPLNTQTAITRLKNELEKARAFGWTPDNAVSESIERGWTAVKAEWLKDKNIVSIDDNKPRVPMMN